MYLIASSFGITPADYEESCLQDRIDTSAQTDLLTKLDTVDGVEVDVVLCNVALHLTGQVLLQAFHIPRAVQQEASAVNQFLNHIVLTNVRRIVAGREVGLADKVCGLDRVFTKTQMRNGQTAGLLGVIFKVCLSIHVGVVTDDLDGVLVRANGTVSTQTPELAADGGCRSRNRILADLQRQVGHIINDTDGEALLLLYCYILR